MAAQTRKHFGNDKEREAPTLSGALQPCWPRSNFVVPLTLMGCEERVLKGFQQLIPDKSSEYATLSLVANIKQTFAQAHPT